MIRLRALEDRVAAATAGAQGGAGAQGLPAAELEQLRNQVGRRACCCGEPGCVAVPARLPGGCSAGLPPRRPPPPDGRLPRRAGADAALVAGQLRRGGQGGALAGLGSSCRPGAAMPLLLLDGTLLLPIAK